jgi:hypothetical protein
VKLWDVPGQQFSDAVDGVINDSVEDMAKIELGVESVELGCSF